MSQSVSSIAALAVAVVSSLSFPAVPAVPPPAPVPAPLPAAAQPVATFSIVAWDPATGDLGVAVQSKFFGVGPVVPFARAGIGAVATQSFANTTYGPRGLDLLEDGMAPAEVIATLTADDEDRAQRQVGVVDASGRAATFTGDECLQWAGGVTGEHYAAQGNILAGPQVVEAMAAAFETLAGDLATRLVGALAAGQAAGGDARGRQSAALLVVRAAGGYGGYDDRYIDLRVDDHPEPIRELQRLLDMKHGQLAGSRAGELARQAREAEGDERQRLLGEALAAAEEAVDLYPGNEWGWMQLAGIRLQLGDDQAAADAAARALVVNPWIKTALVRGTFGPSGIVERLLQVESFRRLWEAVPAAEPSPEPSR